MVGLVYNFKQSQSGISFTAIRAHYKTVDLFQLQKGVLEFKHYTGGMVIGPMTLTGTGPFYKFAIGSFTIVGRLNIGRVGFGQEILSRFIQPRTTGGILLNVLRNLRS